MNPNDDYPPSPMRYEQRGDDCPPGIHLAQYWRDDDGPYDELRQRHLQQCDDDYRAWRAHRFASEFDRWRRERRSANPTHFFERSS